MKLFVIFLLVFPILSSAQIKIDLREKTTNDLSGDIYYQNVSRPSDGYEISHVNLENSGYDRVHINLLNIGCPTITTNKNHTKVFAANYAGDIFIYDLPTGRLERTISFSNLNLFKNKGSNQNSIITSISLTDNEQYLVFKTYNFNGNTDKFIDYYVLDLNNTQTSYPSQLIGFYSLYSFPNMELLNETIVVR